MRLSLSRLRPLHIVLLSAAYWIGLAVVKLGAAIAAAWQVSRLPPNHGTISAGLENALLRLTIARDGIVVWAGSVSLAALIGWVVGPPLLLALTCRWIRETEAAEEHRGATVPGGFADGPTAPLPPPARRWQAGQRAASEAAREVEARRPGAG